MLPARAGPWKLNRTSGFRPLDFGARYRPARLPLSTPPLSEIDRATDSGRNGDPDGEVRPKIHRPERDGAATAGAAGSAFGGGAGFNGDLATDSGAAGTAALLANCSGLLVAGVEGGGGGAFSIGRLTGAGDEGAEAGAGGGRGLSRTAAVAARGADG